MKTAIIILIISFIADQLLQLKSIRQTKHKDTMALLLHVACWSTVMFVYASLVMIKTGIHQVMMWWSIITVIHFLVEWVCLRAWTHHFYNKSKHTMVLWILLEQIVLNVSMLWLFDYLVL